MTGDDDSTAWRRGLVLVLLFALACGTAWTVFAVGHGLRLTGDSCQFMEQALSLHTGRAFDPPPTRAPLYMLLVGLVMFLEPFPVDAAAWVSGAAFTTTLVALGAIALRGARDPIVALALVAVAAMWPGLLFQFDVAWTEQVFVAFLMCHAWFVVRHVDTGRGGALALAGAALAAAMLTRYVGAPLFGLFAAYAAWDLLRRGRRGLWTTLATLVLTPLPLAAWLVRNLVHAGTASGERGPSTLDLFHNLDATARVMTEGLEEVHGLGWLLLGACAALGLALHELAGSPAASRRARGEPGDSAALAALLYLGAVPASYLLAVVHAASTVRIDAINARFLAPVYPFVLAFVALGYGAARRFLPVGELSGRVVRLATYTLLGAGLGGLVSPLRTYLSGIAQRRWHPAAHVLAGYDRSPTASSLGQLLASELQDRDALTLGVLMNPCTPRDAAILWRRATWGDLEVRTVTDQEDRRFDVQVRLDGRDRVVHYEALGPVASERQVRRRLEEALEQSGAREMVVLVVPSGLEAMVGEGDLGLLGDDRLAIEQIEFLRPHVAWRVRVEGSPGLAREEGASRSAAGDGDPSGRGPRRRSAALGSASRRQRGTLGAAGAER